MRRRKVIKEQLSIRLDIDTVEKIIEIADTKKISVNQVINDIVEDYFTKDK